jgi:hypothetical protein
MQPHWLPPAELRARLPRLSGLEDLGTVDVALPPSTDALPRELAHDRWLRTQVDGAGEVDDEAVIAPGAMTAVRLLAPLGEHPAGWLVEPAHFHLARDHLVMVAGAARGLVLEQAQRLVESIRPLLGEESMALTLLSATRWLLASSPPLRLSCASAEAASGRNVHGYLPGGADDRRYRRLLNDIQMTWHDHPVNQEREARGELPINSVWTSGPVTPRAVAAWNEGLAQRRFALDESLLDARLRDDPADWLDALAALDARLHGLLTATDTPSSVLLCGDNDGRWLQRRPRAGPAWPAAIGAGVAGIARSLRSRLPRRATPADAHRQPHSSDPKTEALARMFTETQSR